MAEFVLLTLSLLVVLLVFGLFLVMLTAPALLEAWLEAGSDPEVVQRDADRQAADEFIAEVADGD